MADKKNHLLLLFGMPRSGTTWLAKIIDSHPDVVYRHEPDSENKLSLPIMATDDVDYAEELRHFAHQLKSYRSVRTCGKAPFFEKSYFNPLTFAVFKGSVWLSKLARRFDANGKILESIADTPSELTVLWKSIESVGRIEPIMRALPHAKMVFIMRHPCGQIASTLRGENKRKFASGSATSEDYGVYTQLLKQNYAKQNGLTLDYIQSLNPVQRLAVRWVLFNEQALNNLDAYPSRSLLVRYRDICNQPVYKSKEIFKFAGLSWTNQSEAFLNRSVSTNKEAYYSVYKSPNTSLNVWKTELSDVNIDEIKQIISGSRAGQFYQDDFYS